VKNAAWSQMLAGFGSSPASPHESLALEGSPPKLVDITSTTTSSGLTIEEKEAILKQFEKQNLQMELLGDASFMQRYRSMTAKLLHMSDRSDTSNPKCE
jgi:hypothetical protein